MLFNTRLQRTQHTRLVWSMTQRTPCSIFNTHSSFALRSGHVNILKTSWKAYVLQKKKNLSAPKSDNFPSKAELLWPPRLVFQTKILQNKSFSNYTKGIHIQTFFFLIEHHLGEIPPLLFEHRLLFSPFPFIQAKCFGMCVQKKNCCELANDNPNYHLHIRDWSKWIWRLGSICHAPHSFQTFFHHRRRHELQSCKSPQSCYYRSHGTLRWFNLSP